jgi:GTPase SAR1 family protein
LEISFNAADNRIIISKGNKQIDSIPCYGFIYKKEVVCIGLEAFKQIDVFPKYVFGLSELIINNDQEKLKLLMDAYNSAENYGLTPDLVNARPEFMLDIRNSLGEQIVLDRLEYKALSNLVIRHIIDTLKLDNTYLTHKDIRYLRNIIAKKYSINDILRNCSGGLIERIRIPDDQCTLKATEINFGAINPHEINELKSLRQLNGKNDKEITEKLISGMDGEFKVIAVSPFSFGKSTLINALLGYDLLQTDVRAETSNITKIMHAGTNLCLFQNDNMSNRNSFSELKDLKAELSHRLESLGYKKTGKEIKILCSLNELQDICLLDAPGLFSRYQEHDELVKNAIKECDMILFIIDPVQIGEKHFAAVMAEYTEYLKNANKDFCFVISKLDMYEDDEQKILGELKIVLNGLGLAQYKYFFISGYFALKGRQFRSGQITLDDLRRDKWIYAEENGFRVSGRRLDKSHAEGLIEKSRIKELEEYIIYKKEAV